jgi:tetratricopeptide (TPR) repeat protein
MIENIHATQEQTSKQTLTDDIDTVQRRFRKNTYRRNAFESVLRDYYEHLHKRGTTTQDYIAKALGTLHMVLNQPTLVSRRVLIDCTTEILRFVGEVGLGVEFAEQFVDRIIHIYQQEGYSLAELYVAKSRYLPVTGIEHHDREKIFLEARSYAEKIGNHEDVVLILLELAEYYTLVSQYKKSIIVCQECDQIIALHDTLQKHHPLVLVNLGMNYFCLFNFAQAKDYFLKAASLLQTVHPDENDYYQQMHVLSNALHYLGREEQRCGNFALAMRYYMDAYQCQQRGLQEAGGAVAFYHLRMGELLLQMSLIDHARDHFHVCQEMINTSIVVGTANIQLQLAWGVLYEREGNYERARACMQGALAEARKNNTSRMELRCLQKRFLMECRHYRFHSVARIFFDIVKTMRNGELRKGSILRFVRLLRPSKLLQRLFPAFLKKKSNPSLLQGNYSGPWFPGNGKREPLKNRSHGGKHGATLLAHGGEITANDTESRRPLGTAKGARNLLLDFYHPQIPLGLVVCERHAQIIQESKHLLGSR